MNRRIKHLNETFSKILESCPELVFIGDPVLRTKTEPVDLKQGIEIGKRLHDILKTYRGITGFGRGLAAPQIGINKSVFVTFVDNTFKTYINPEIISYSETVNLYRETCLSCGSISADVKRPESVEVRYLNESGETTQEHLESFLARLIQHEYDHLEGIVNIDRAETGSIEFMINDPLEEKLRNC